MKDYEITPKVIAEHNLSDEEYERITNILNREPTIVELGIFSVMWSEHASYKNSVLLLKTLPKEGSSLLAKAGEENAGLIDIGHGLAISFKIESHNHPSALEPYHGAATGVGGILRDIFTMGARPIAALNSLRFGNPGNPKVQHLLKEVVRGIADYGNCFGVPTVGGEVYFDDSYEGNPLVNAMAVGIVKHNKIARSAASGVGNAVLIVGAKTGRDGIHGATFASVDLSEKSEEKRTAVQVGDPFLEKLLLEATLEAIDEELVVAIQDMGAAGITCSTSEMAGKGNVGIEIDVALVPQRETDMTPYEIMLSESQERMLVIVKPENLEQIKSIFTKWELDAVQIGKVTDDKMLRVFYGEEKVAEIPAETLILGGSAPVYKRESKYPEYLDALHNYDIENLPEPDTYQEVLLKLIASSNISSRHQIYQQYDHMVQIGTVVEPGSDAAVVRIPDTDLAIGLSTDCNGRYCYLDPYLGALLAVAESARNVACSGAKPIAITNCLNFGNPYKPEVYYCFKESIRGMSDACKALGTPVTGGNVSFYNENPEGAIYPTPVIGMLGLMTDYRKATTQYFKHENDIIVLLGSLKASFGGSEYLKIQHNIIAGKPPIVDLEEELHLQDLILELIDKGLVNSAHDISEGGLLIAVLESCFNPEQLFGAKLSFDLELNPAKIYFGEAAGRILISAAKDKYNSIKEAAMKHGIEYHKIGIVSANSSFIVNNHINEDMAILHSAWKQGII
ncbi:MAG TPA: phosphoribosylformylglycinamidine synthase subunit PurL [Candidatus Cloacimonas sp.]|mgnify:FL=1|jgi:phosphoribosylformylglycinamidine synthase|nr:phosphoribosylformylglycinamidine synthase subunit PurL [Candidatus Cloacimonadota bacterium]HOG27243.1 phosphoribosylformylglycinamidine synthase subunit PurL [Candidatus Cloacimonas sp.]HPH71411.1 phosphoribosylformylglycinamidine synthase subunit PurL [Candidatus Cloacimonas sp.]HPK60102.1 phosphoribosylformylglycinamidine synthase subunit PurL [Candidatus Cloacimonas sp.]HPV64265.1 phosphoribosylformylglycinamidine synthase subunit PurL [Candidatus Cloacimonas sp.]